MLSCGRPRQNKGTEARKTVTASSLCKQRIALLVSFHVITAAAKATLAAEAAAGRPNATAEPAVAAVAVRGRLTLACLLSYLLACLRAFTQVPKPSGDRCIAQASELFNFSSCQSIEKALAGRREISPLERSRTNSVNCTNLVCVVW